MILHKILRCKLYRKWKKSGEKQTFTMHKQNNLKIILYTTGFSILRSVSIDSQCLRVDQNLAIDGDFFHLK